MKTIMSLEDIVAACVEMKSGNKEFALFWYPKSYADEAAKRWLALFGNEAPCCPLGESPAEFEAEGATAEEAVVGILNQLTEKASQDRTP